MSKASFTSMLVGLLGLLLPAVTQAQRSKGGDIPAGHKPPAGMCRIWVDGVPAGQQPAATDCATAIRTRPSNGRVIFGDEKPNPRSSKDPLITPGWTKRPKQDPPREERRAEPRTEQPAPREQPRTEERKDEKPPRKRPW